MSVLIKGMQMPHDCFECPLSIPPVSDDSPLWMCGGNAMFIHEANTEEHRPYGCPLAEVTEEMRHGRWKDVEPAPHNLFYATCSVCGDRQTIEVANFCPMCGSRMDLEGDTE